MKKNNELFEFSAMEFNLLPYLIEQRGEVLKRGELLDEVWNSGKNRKKIHVFRNIFKQFTDSIINSPRKK